MLTHDEFKLALKLDFSDLNPDGNDFECLVQELLQEMGFDAQRTGVGSDLGVDIIAEEILIDRFGIKQSRKYIIQCKHNAHSQKAIGTNEISDVLDTISRHNAQGYALVTSADITTSLRTKLNELDEKNPQINIIIWDKIYLEQQLNKYPAILAKYFPTRLQQVKVSVPIPKGKKETYVRDKILNHQREYIGSKFIPKLYVRRQVEETVYKSLMSPVDELVSAKKIYFHELKSWIDSFSDLINAPEYFYPISGDDSIVCKWKFDLSTLKKKTSSLNEKILKYPWNPEKDYIFKGIIGLKTSFDELNFELNKYTELVSELLTPFYDLYESAKKIRLAERGYSNLIEGLINQKLGELDTSGNSISEYREKYRDLKEKYKTINKPVWITENTFFEKLNMESVNSVQLNLNKAQIMSFQDIERKVQSINKLISQKPTLKIKNKLADAQKFTLGIVDIAGSGKTNLCCRLALQIINKCFTIFLTGKALGKEFTDVIEYIENSIKEALHIKEDIDFDSLCTKLQQSNYPLVIILDGINESTNLSQIKQQLFNLLKKSGNVPIRILLTSRIEYWNIFRQILDYDYVTIVTGGLANFTEDEHHIAIPVYLDHYKLRVRLENRAWEQLKRPLLLRFFCEAYGNPSSSFYRNLPPIVEVRLMRLFGEYCRVKYANISERLNSEMLPVSVEDVEQISLNLAKEFLDRKRRDIDVNLIKQFFPKEQVKFNKIYSSLLDEDVIIEENIDYKNNRLDKTVSFVYEAFMEFLMSRVLLNLGELSQEALLNSVNNLIKVEASFVHIRGILIFLLPDCVDKHTKVFETILSQFERIEYAESCVPAILNLYDSDWNKGILPTLKASSKNLLSLPREPIQTFVEDWLQEHSSKDFLLSVINHTKTMTKMFGEKIVKIISNYASTETTLTIKSLLQIIKETNSYSLTEETLKTFLKEKFFSNDIKINNVHLFALIVENCIPILVETYSNDRHNRNWSILDLTGEIGENWGVNDLNYSFLPINQIIQAVESGIIDEYIYRNTVSSKKLWWANLLNINAKTLEIEAREWIDDPSNRVVIMDGEGEFRLIPE